MREAAEAGTNVEEELGDLLFAVVNAARFLDVDPEVALNRATDKFIARFQRVEDGAIRAGSDIKSMPLPELEQLWQEAKENRRNSHE
ncbi:MAG: hypothetical protein IJ792_04680 [Oscillospiraceae bacterium]|nr:hypothetical protein [Oscillospiraceae bacterium]